MNKYYIKDILPILEQDRLICGESENEFYSRRFPHCYWFTVKKKGYIGKKKMQEILNDYKPLN